jgi:predicted metal-dependent RNase
VVHGDPDAAQAFAARIQDALHLEAHVPTYLETVQLR